MRGGYQRRTTLIYRPEHSPNKSGKKVTNEGTDDDVSALRLKLNNNNNDKVLSERRDVVNNTKRNERQREEEATEEQLIKGGRFTEDIERDEKMRTRRRMKEEKTNCARGGSAVDVLERFARKLETDFLFPEEEEEEEEEEKGARSFNRRQKETDERFRLLRTTLEESTSSLEKERRAYASEATKMEREKREVLLRTKEAMEEAKKARETEERANEAKEKEMQTEMDRLKRSLRDFERTKENEMDAVERRCVDAVNRAKERELKIEEACEEKLKRMKEEKRRDLEAIAMKHDLEMEHVRSKLGEKSEDESEIRKKMREMESELEKARRDARRAKEEKEKLREQAGMARKKLEELMETMKARDAKRDADVELLREEHRRREEEFTETMEANKVKRDQEMEELLEQRERDAQTIARLEKRVQTAETASIAVKFLCEEAQKAIEDSEIAAAYAERRAARLASGFGSSSSSDVSSSSDEEDEKEKEGSKLKFRKRADAANLRLERSLRDARATLRECIERKKTMLLESEYDEVNDENDEASFEEKRRELFAFNVVKNVADIRVSFLTRAIASVRLSRRCGALEGLIAGRADRTVDENEDEVEKVEEEDYYRSMNNTIDTIEEEDYDNYEDEDEDDFKDEEYVSWY